MVQASDIDLCQARELFPRFNRLTDPELSNLLTHNIFGPNALLQKGFNPDAHLFKDSEGRIAGMETEEGE